MEELESQTDETISRGIGVSFAIHALLISFFTLKTVFFTPESIDFSQAVRVDIVGLPDKIKENTLPAEKPTEKATEKLPDKPAEKVTKKEEPPKLPPVTSKKNDGVNLKKVKTQQKNALDKLKAMAALDKIKQATAEEKSKNTQNSAPIKGNVLSPGSSLTGLSKLQHDNFAADLDRHIKQNWAIPEWLANRDLKAQARVFIDSRGNVLGRKIVKSSGNPSYDEEVLATIDRSAPFPAPPEKFLAIVSVDGILIGFPE